MAQQKDPVMALNELCQKSSWPMPAFAVQQVGNPPRFRVQASVTVDGVEGKVAGQEAPSKKQAKKAAASAWLQAYVLAMDDQGS